MFFSPEELTITYYIVITINLQSAKHFKSKLLQCNSLTILKEKRLVFYIWCIFFYRQSKFSSESRRNNRLLVFFQQQQYIVPKLVFLIHTCSTFLLSEKETLRQTFANYWGQSSVTYQLNFVNFVEFFKWCYQFSKVLRLFCILERSRNNYYVHLCLLIL